MADAQSAAATRAVLAGAGSGVAGGGGGGAAVAAAAAPLAGSLSLDAVVANLDKPESLSTLAKTNIDWEQYKVAQGA
jgi:hypothetical protein